jgi:DNA-binding sugar fermentation-stimulating protein
VAVVGAHPQLAERLAAEMLRRRCLEGALGPYQAVETQRTYGNTRVDFVLRMADGSWCASRGVCVCVCVLKVTGKL